MNKRCIIITSYLETSIKDSVAIDSDDYVICADGGITHAISGNVVPNIVIGDFDSSDYSAIEHLLDQNPDYSQTKLIRTVPEKDDTDTLMCVNHGLEKGCDEFVIVGGLGGRLDHTYANLQILSYLVDQGHLGVLVDGKAKAIIIEGPDEIELTGKKGSYFSIFSYTEKCTGVYEKKSKYLLNDATITQSNPLGTSNEFLDKPVIISVGSGKLLIIQPNIE